MALLARLRKEHVFDGLYRTQEALIRLFSGEHLDKLVVELEGGIPMNDTEVWIAIAAERIELADFLETLTPEEWDAQSLCEEWKVRDVVAHLIFVTGIGLGRALVGVAKSGFNPNKYVARTAIAAGSNLLKTFKSNCGTWQVRRNCPRYVSRGTSWRTRWFTIRTFGGRLASPAPFPQNA